MQYICIVAAWAKRDVLYSFLIEKSTEWLVFKAGARLICPFSDFSLFGSFFISHSPFHCRNKLVNSIYYSIYNLDSGTTHTHTLTPFLSFIIKFWGKTLANAAFKTHSPCALYYYLWRIIRSLNLGFKVYTIRLHVSCFIGECINFKFLLIENCLFKRNISNQHRWCAMQ